MIGYQVLRTPPAKARNHSSFMNVENCSPSVMTNELTGAVARTRSALERSADAIKSGEARNVNGTPRSRNSKKGRRPSDSMNVFTPIKPNQEASFSSPNGFSISQTTTGPTMCTPTRRHNGLSESHAVTDKHHSSRVPQGRPRTGSGGKLASARRPRPQSFADEPASPTTQVTILKKVSAFPVGGPADAKQRASRTSPTNYCGPKFTESPDPSCVPMPPSHWLGGQSANEDAEKENQGGIELVKSLPLTPTCGAGAFQPGMRLTGRQLIDLLRA